MIKHAIFYLMILSLLVALDVLDLTIRKKYTQQAAVKESILRLWKSLASAGVLGFLLGYNGPAFVIAMGALFVEAAIIHKGLTRVAGIPLMATAPDSLGVLNGFLNRLPRIRASGLDIPISMMMAAATTEYRPASAAGFTETRNVGGADDDGDGNHAEQVEHRNQSHQQGQNLSWNELLVKFEALRAEFYEIKAGETSHGSDQN